MRKNCNNNCNNIWSNRIESLDYLRGIMALCVMIYHLTVWNLYNLDASTLLGRLGIYAVSIFFILSGLSIAIANSHFIIDIKSSIAFYIRRIFRIYPLLWVCIIAVVLPSILKGREIPSLKILLLNFTTLFGFIAPTEYINTEPELKIKFSRTGFYSPNRIYKHWSLVNRE